MAYICEGYGDEVGFSCCLDEDVHPDDAAPHPHEELRDDHVHDLHRSGLHNAHAFVPCERDVDAIYAVDCINSTVFDDVRRGYLCIRRLHGIFGDALQPKRCSMLALVPCAG